jgi:hypothetical protein
MKSCTSDKLIWPSERVLGRGGDPSASGREEARMVKVSREPVIKK